jgi:hypothetical protein
MVFGKPIEGENPPFALPVNIVSIHFTSRLSV